MKPGRSVAFAALHLSAAASQDCLMVSKNIFSQLVLRLKRSKNWQHTDEISNEQFLFFKTQKIVPFVEKHQERN